jgi:hypothetical protein
MKVNYDFTHDLTEASASFYDDEPENMFIIVTDGFDQLSIKLSSILAKDLTKALQYCIRQIKEVKRNNRKGENGPCL